MNVCNLASKALSTLSRKTRLTLGAVILAALTGTVTSTAFAGQTLLPYVKNPPSPCALAKPIDKFQINDIGTKKQWEFLKFKNLNKQKAEFIFSVAFVNGLPLNFVGRGSGPTACYDNSVAMLALRQTLSTDTCGNIFKRQLNNVAQGASTVRKAVSEFLQTVDDIKSTLSIEL